MLDEKMINDLRSRLPVVFEPKLWSELAESADVRRVPSGETIMDYGRFIRSVPIVISGSIKVVRRDQDDKELFLYFLSEGDTCPMSFSCCMADKRSSIRTTAEDDVVLISIPLKKVEHLMSTYQSWTNFIFHSYEKRLNVLLETIDNIAFKKLDERLLDYLNQKSEAIGSPKFEITHHQVAKDLNASREAVSRLLKKLEADKVVKLGRNAIELL